MLSLDDLKLCLFNAKDLNISNGTDGRHALAVEVEFKCGD